MEILAVVVAAIVVVWWFGFGRTVESLANMAQSQVELMADKQAITQNKFYSSSSVNIREAVKAAKIKSQLRATRLGSLDDLEEMLADMEAEKPKRNRATTSTEA